jgi:hypothetical protein
VQALRLVRPFLQFNTEVALLLDGVALTPTFDRDAKFSPEIVAAVRAMGSQLTRTSFRSPWQNGMAERWVGSCRQDLLNHVIAFNERHLKRLLIEYIRYYHEDRTHLGLRKQTPLRRVAASGRRAAQIVSQARLGGLHHRYDVAA